MNNLNELNGKGLSAKEKLERIRDLLNEVESNGKDKLAYVAPNLAKLAEMMEDCEQYDIDLGHDFEPILVDRVFKANRVIPKWVLEVNHINHCTIGGLFLELPCYILPADRVNAASNAAYKGRGARVISVMNPEKFGLPSDDVANYSTLKYVNSSCYVCLPKFPLVILKDWLTSAKYIEYVRTN